MKAIIGLGNIGEIYAKNRHNVGFQFIKFGVGSLKIERKKSYKFSIIYECKLKGRQILIVKPTALMNLSGLSAKEVMHLYSLNLKDLLIVHDDLDIELGKYKLQKRKGPAGHNGVIDIENKLKNKDFLRLRIGIENRKDMLVPGEEYVLSDFLEKEIVIINDVFKKAWQEVLEVFILD